MLAGAIMSSSQSDLSRKRDSFGAAIPAKLRFMFERVGDPEMTSASGRPAECWQQTHNATLSPADLVADHEWVEAFVNLLRNGLA